MDETAEHKAHEEKSHEASPSHEPAAHAHKEKEHKEKKSIRQTIRDVYDKEYKRLLIIPLIIFILAVAQIGYQVATTGDFVNKGVSLKGGVTVTIATEASVNILEIEDFLKSKFPQADLSVREVKFSSEKNGVIIEASDVTYSDIISAVEERIGKVSKDDYTVEEMGGSLGESFFRETLVALLIAFVCMALVVFITFRTFVPSAAVVLAAALDILETLAVFNLLGLKLSTAGIAAFLMLIGYSVDTDILLSTRVLKRTEGTVLDRVIGSIGTGMTMTITTISAVTIGLFLTQSEVIRQIMIIILIGLFFDIFNTWITNAGILRMYLERKHKSR